MDSAILSRRVLWRQLPAVSRRELSSVLIGSGASTAGNSVHIVAAALLALQLSGAPASVPLIALVGTLPPLLLIGVVRAVVRRFGGRRVLIAIDFVSCVLAASLPLIALSGTLELWQVYAQELLMACCSAFYAPASRAWSSQIARSEASLNLTNTLLGSVMQVAGVIGWGVGGWLSVQSSPLGAMTVNSATFLLSALIQTWGFWGRIRVDNAARDPRELTPLLSLRLIPLLRSTFDGSRAGYLARSLVVILMAQRLQFSLFIVFLTVAVQVSESIVGLANAAYSVGAAAGAALATGGAIGLWIRRHPTGGIIAMFGSLLAFGLAPSGVVAIPVYAGVGLLSTSVIVVQSLLQDLRRESASDVFAALGAIQSLLNMIALAVLSLLLIILSVRTTYVVVIVVCGTLAILFLLGGRPSRRTPWSVS